MYDRDPASNHDTPRPPAVYRVTHDPDGPATLSTTVVHALADCLGVDVTDATFTLYDSIDPDALDAIFRPRYDGAARTGGHVSFVVQRHYVTVYADGEILIEPTEATR